MITRPRHAFRAGPVVPGPVRAGISIACGQHAGTAAGAAAPVASDIETSAFGHSPIAASPRGDERP